MEINSVIVYSEKLRDDAAITENKGFAKEQKGQYVF